MNAKTADAFKLRDQNVSDAMGTFSSILSDIGKKYDTLASKWTEKFAPTWKGAEAKARRRLLSQTFIQTNEELTPWLDEFISPDKHGEVLGLIEKIVLDDEFKPSMLTKIESLVSSKFESEMLGLSQEYLTEALPKEMLKFLPPKIIIDVDSEGRIQTITDLFANEKKKIDVKIRTMRTLIDKYNTIVKQVRADMQSPDSIKRLKATCLMLILETGIRPGQGESDLKDEQGNKIKDEEGNPIRVETFGASSLKASHIKKFLPNAVEFEFRGKASTINRATITNTELIGELKRLAFNALFQKSYFLVDDFIFSYYEEGTWKHLDKSQINRYFKNIAGTGLSPTDFRKLKATKTVFESLKKQRKSLLSRIREIVKIETEHLKERVAEEVASVINLAIEEAQIAISHSGKDVTIDQYINPIVVMKFLSQGRLERTLQDTIKHNPEYLEFNPQTFIDLATGVKRASAFDMRIAGFFAQASLQDLIDELEEELGE